MKKQVVCYRKKRTRHRRASLAVSFKRLSYQECKSSAALGGIVHENAKSVKIEPLFDRRYHHVVRILDFAGPGVDPDLNGYI